MNQNKKKEIVQTESIKLEKMYLNYKQAARYIAPKAKGSPLRILKRSPVRRHTWSYEEERALVEFTAIAKSDPKYGFDFKTEWPSFREGHCFWTDAAAHIQTSTCANVLLTSKLNYNNFLFDIIFIKPLTLGLYSN